MKKKWKWCPWAALEEKKLESLRKQKVKKVMCRSEKDKDDGYYDIMDLCVCYIG